MFKNPVAPMIILLFFLSGFCNLVYEVVWARMFNLVFGVTVFAVSAVLAAFMLGMALGGVFFGKIADKPGNNLAFFAFVHVGISIFAVLFLLGFGGFGPVYLAAGRALGQHVGAYRTVIFLLALVLMIVPTTLMGATFPLAARLLALRRERYGRDVGILYSANTLGSVAGCIVAVFVLLGLLGMKGTVYAAAGLDAVVGVAALAVWAAFRTGNRSA